MKMLRRHLSSSGALWCLTLIYQHLSDLPFPFHCRCQTEKICQRVCEKMLCWKSWRVSSAENDAMYGQAVAVGFDCLAV